MRSKRGRITGMGLAAVVLVGAGIAAPGCKRHAKPGPQDAMVRLINAVPGADSLQFTTGERDWKRIGFRKTTGYHPIREGSYPVKVCCLSITQSVNGGKPLQFTKGKTYTVLAVGPATGGNHAITMPLLWDDFSEPVPPDQARIRVINGSPDVGAVDVLFNNIVGLPNVSFGKRSKPVLVRAGDYWVKVTHAGGVQSLIEPVQVRLEGGRTYTAVTTGQPTFEPLELQVFRDR